MKTVTLVCALHAGTAPANEDPMNLFNLVIGVLRVAVLGYFMPGWLVELDRGRVPRTAAQEQRNIDEAASPRVLLPGTCRLDLKE